MTEKKAKAVNYTAEQTAALVQGYLAGEPVAWMNVELKPVAFRTTEPLGDIAKRDWMPLYAVPVDAYRAGAEAMRERAAKACEKIAEDAWATYKGRLPGREKVRVYHSHDQGRCDGAAECEEAIRALTVEEGK